MRIFKKKRMTKKASLQLSINAIVVLVMAMVVLGLGLSFIRNLIGQGENQLGKTIDNIDLNLPASATDRITIPSEISLKRGGSTEVEVGFYNINSNGLMASPALCKESGGKYKVGGSGWKLECVDTKKQKINDKQIVISAPAAKVESGTAEGFLAIISDGCQNLGDSYTDCKSNKLKSGDYVCSIKIYGSKDGELTSEESLESDQIIIHVTN